MPVGRKARNVHFLEAQLTFNEESVKEQNSEN